MLTFEWDARKSTNNKRKHGVSFEEAQTIFFDENAIEYPDPDHSREEDRFLMLGCSYQLRILVVCHCYRKSLAVVQIISARKATSRERRVYSRRGKQ